MPNPGMIYVGTMELICKKSAAKCWLGSSKHKGLDGRSKRVIDTIAAYVGRDEKGADIQVIIANHIIVQPVGREAILLGLEDNVYYELNETGVFVFEQLRAGNGIDAIAQKLSDQFDVDLDTATRDVKMLIESLIQKGIVSKLDLV